MQKRHHSTRRGGKEEKSARSALSLPAARVLRFGLPVIAAEMAGVLFLFLAEREKDPTFALHRYPPMFEYLMMGLTLLIIGAFLFDYIAKKEEAGK